MVKDSQNRKKKADFRQLGAQLLAHTFLILLFEGILIAPSQRPGYKRKTCIWRFSSVGWGTVLLSKSNHMMKKECEV